MTLTKGMVIAMGLTGVLALLKAEEERPVPTSQPASTPASNPVSPSSQPSLKLVLAEDDTGWWSRSDAFALQHRLRTAVSAWSPEQGPRAWLTRNQQFVGKRVNWSGTVTDIYELSKKDQEENASKCGLYVTEMQRRIQEQRAKIKDPKALERYVSGEQPAIDRQIMWKAAFEAMARSGATRFATVQAEGIKITIRADPSWRKDAVVRVSGTIQGCASWLTGQELEIYLEP